ncbi:hypothetical protein EON82_09375 [bacterium]|nr:MAG: hypothetical protein EON82_09375 [bacterium]
MKIFRSILPAVAASLALVGCGADSGTTAEQDAAFKSGAKPTVNIPPGANKPPENFKSSLDTGGGPRPPAGNQ